MAGTGITKKNLGINSIIVAATIILAGLKLAGVLDIGWVGVFIPLIIWTASVIAQSAMRKLARKAVKKGFSATQKAAYEVCKSQLHMDEAEAVMMVVKMAK